MKLRYERKYLVNNEFLEPMRKRFMPFLVPDLNADSTELKSEYTVRSIYFDTPHFDSLSEKNEGLENRLKLRIRGYNSYFSGCEVFLEIKRKLGNRIAKNRAITLYDLLEKTLETGELKRSIGKSSEHMKEDAARFLYHLHREAQRPVNLVVYDREPYHGKFDPGVRITFDKNIRAAVFPHLSELFTNEGLTYVWKDAFILEIKYFEGGMPSWCKSIIQEFEIKHEALSKYASAFQHLEISTLNQRIF
ncbi:MAG TPA: polyphosphate polymerase domain-containing protein [Bacteroidia bacterium]|nr:polyphosphate polymerase domain-containing protein [Bacteroidia bacterium]